MKAMVCELCGSNDFVKQDNYFVCQHCGTKYTLEDAKKLLGTVKIDTSEELNKLYTVARRAKDDDNAESAVKYYEQILAMDPMSWEASFYVVYFRATQCKVAQIQSAAISVSNCLNSTLSLIKSDVKTEADQIKAVSEICTRVISLSYLLFTAYKEQSKLFADSAAARDLDYHLGDSIDSIFDGDAYRSLSIEAWKAGLVLHGDSSFMDSEKWTFYRKKVGDTYFQIIGKGKTAAELLSVAASKMEENSFDEAQGIFLELEKDAELKPIALLGQGVYIVVTSIFYEYKSTTEAIQMLHSAENCFTDSLKSKYKDQIKSIVRAHQIKSTVCEHPGKDYTALMVAAEKLDVPLLRFLLSLGADVNAKNDYNQTALWLMTCNSNKNVNAMVETTKVLLDAGAEANVVSSDGQSLLSRSPAPVKKLILEKDPSAKSSNTGACYVATAVYGSYDCPEVWTLRRFRDDMLAETWYGRAFVRIYYAISPTLVKWFGKKIWFKNLWKHTLDKMVLKLNKAGLEDTPYQDRKW